ncbi:hypothetical protein RRG08_011225 [Elysia crispata]|uniref:Methyltransferase type 11 domain-containing protein n=1 Tax=Elysia crispata TaxID=231223 RepID=A0AAE0XZA0_9GAST|nr:hypothetical protein RRG08_011225 [Elysia crispata]
MKPLFHYRSPGLIGKELYNRGFRNIDAHDGAAAMVDFCRTTGHYKEFYTCLVDSGHTLPIKDNRYDAISCSVATVINHLPPSTQHEIIRIIKPGGYVPS